MILLDALLIGFAFGVGFRLAWRFADYTVFAAGAFVDGFVPAFKDGSRISGQQTAPKGPMAYPPPPSSND